MTTDKNPYEEGKRAGSIRSSSSSAPFSSCGSSSISPCPAETKAGHRPRNFQVVIGDPDAAPVMFKVQATLTEFNAVSIVVPAQVTTSQGCRPAEAVQTSPAGSESAVHAPGHEPPVTNSATRAVADLYIFSDPKYATPDVVGTWHAEPMLRATSTPGDSFRRGDGTGARPLPHRSERHEQPRHRRHRICRRIRGSQ